MFLNSICSGLDWTAVKAAAYGCLVEHEAVSDGGVECLLHVAKYYCSEFVPTKLDFLLSNFYPRCSIVSLCEAAYFVGLEGLVCSDLSLFELSDFNAPCVIRILYPDGATGYAVFIRYSEMEGFVVWDWISGERCLGIYEFSACWISDVCLVFVPLVL